MAGIAPDEGVKKASSFFTPILPYFLAGFSAFLLSGTFGCLRDFSAACLRLAMFLALCEATVFVLSQIFELSPRRKSLLAAVCYGGRICAVFLLAVWYFNFRMQANPYENFAPRYVSVTARIDEVSTGVNDSRYGVATIVSAPENLKRSVGMKMWYVVSDGKNRTGKNRDFITSQTVRFRGVFASTYPDECKARGFFADKPESRAFEKYLHNRFIFFKMSSRVADSEIIKEADPRYVFYRKVYGYMSSSLSRLPFGGRGESEAALTYRAMILGDKSLLTPLQKQSFMDTGTMHVFAISGLHIGFAAALLYGMLSLFRVNWRIQPFAALPVLYLYVCACGSRPSSLRAFGMIALVWLALSLSRGMRPFPSLVLAASIALIASPENIFDAGFVLSYSIVAAILIYSIPLYNCAMSAISGKFSVAGTSSGRRFAAWLERYFVAAFCISLGAMFACAPLSAHYFSYVAPMSVFYSPVFVSGAGIAVGLGFAGFGLPSFIAEILNAIAVLIVGAMSSFAQFGARIWSGKIEMAMPDLLLAYFAVFGFLAISAVFENRRGLFLRFVLAPIFTMSIMAFVYLKNG